MSRTEPTPLVAEASRGSIFGAARLLTRLAAAGRVLSFEPYAKLPGNRNRQGGTIATRAFGAFIGAALTIAAAHTAPASPIPLWKSTVGHSSSLT
jgi:hypothetical protein